MMDFSFFNPTRVLFGRTALSQMTALVPAGARILILYGGGSVVRNGTLARVQAALDGYEIHEFGGIEPNPSFEKLMEAVTLVREQDISFLIALGGGSVIDGAKFVAAAVYYDGDPWDILLTRGNRIQAALPLAAIPTLPATGSEMNGTSVITRTEFSAKRVFKSEHVFPVLAVLDPTLTFTLPPRQVANGIVDAFVHVLEQYLTYPVDAPVQDRFAEGLLRVLLDVADKNLAEPENYDARASLMWAATLALNGLIGSGVPQDWSSHLIGHELTALYGLDHARTLAVILPAMLSVRKSEKHAKLLQYAERIWNLHTGSENERIDKALSHTRAFFSRLGLETGLSDYGLGRNAIDSLLASLRQAHGNDYALGEKQTVSSELARAVLEASL
ncbi:iron-containing alcohol dehydrogenase [Gluconobacter thailandicus]|uniref:Iron-containing alcohol dehydrogenase n=1 Tax=Gluconobacter thailandicus TaxID=257438 RepID=A0AAP9JIX6_GLUTH|nr:iron-containing alcohol dehydrogenase [Gluconobacter thailandicus]QEH97788.1 iron-containing alcohol dehydrogenase [Gluconobacter thailandicus]